MVTRNALPEPSEKELRAAHAFLSLGEPFEVAMQKRVIAACIKATARARIKKREQILKRPNYRKLACPDD